MSRVKQKKGKSTKNKKRIPPDFTNVPKHIEKFLDSHTQFIHPPFIGWVPEDSTPRGIFEIEVPKHEGIYTTIHPGYIKRVANEGGTRGDISFMSDIEIQSALVVCNELLKFSHQVLRGEIELDPGAPSLAAWRQTANWCKKTIEALSKGFILKDKAGRYKKPPLPDSHKVEISKKWDTFHGKGMKALKPRYRKHTYSKRLSDLKQFVKPIQSDFPNHINDEFILEELNLSIKKREPLLKVLFGYLTGIVKPPRKKKHAKSKEKQFAYLVKKVDRFLQPPKTRNGQKIKA